MGLNSQGNQRGKRRRLREPWIYIDAGAYSWHIFKYLHFFKMEGEGSRCKVLYKQVRETVYKGCQYLKHDF
jgi:hypothetical protein